MDASAIDLKPSSCNSFSAMGLYVSFGLLLFHLPSETQVSLKSCMQGSMDGTMVRALASHQYGPGLIPGVDTRYVLSLLLVLIPACCRGFSLGTLVCPLHKKPTFPNCNYHCVPTFDVIIRDIFHVLSRRRTSRHVLHWHNLLFKLLSCGHFEFETVGKFCRILCVL